MKTTILSFLIIMSLSAYAQEESTTTEVTTTEEAVAEEVAPPPTPEPPQERWASCDESYLNYVRGLPAAKQKAEFENWWMLADQDFRSVKNDEFQYREVKPKKEAEFTKLLAEKPATQSLVLSVKLGNYDFAKKGFPVDVKLASNDKTFENHFDGVVSMGSFGGPPSATIYSCTTMAMDQKTTDRMPHMVKFKPVNLAQIKFLKIDETKAKQITSGLNSTRVKALTLRLYPAKTNFVKRSIGTLKSNALVVDSEIKEIELSAGDERVLVKF